MKSELRDYGVTQELQNVDLGSLNKIDSVSIPIGVKVYITDSITTDLSRAEELSDYLYLKKNERTFAEPTKLYMHTTGTGGGRLILRLTAVNDVGAYFENKSKSTLSLEDTISAYILNSVHRPIAQGTQNISNLTTFNLDVSSNKSIRFDSDNELLISMNNVDFYPMLEDLIYTDFVDNLYFKNDSGSTATLNYFLG